MLQITSLHAVTAVISNTGNQTKTQNNKNATENSKNEVK